MPRRHQPDMNLNYLRDSLRRTTLSRIINSEVAQLLALVLLFQKLKKITKKESEKEK